MAINVEKFFACVRVINNRAHRDTQGNVGCGRAVHIRAATVFTIFCQVLARVAEVDQGVDVAIRDGEDAAAFAAVTTVGSALGDEFFTAKAVRAVAAFAGNDFNGGFVDEFHALMVP